MNSKISDKDLNTAQSNFPLSPDTTFYALFTHVAVDICTGQDSLGTAKISKVCNDINDEVTLTATPKNAEHTKFDYWIETSLLALLRRYVLTVFEEQLDGSTVDDYLNAINENDVIVNKLYFLLIDYEINNEDDLKQLLSDKSLKDIATKLDY